MNPLPPLPASFCLILYLQLPPSVFKHGMMMAGGRLPSILDSSCRIDGNDIPNEATNFQRVARSLHEETSRASGFEGQDGSKR